MSAPMTTEQRLDHLTDAIGLLSQDARDLRLGQRETRDGLLRIRETQADHTDQIRALRTDMTLVKEMLVQVLDRLPERP